MQPQRIGRYEVVREVGRGAMGVVYLAHDPAIGRSVAIKTVTFEESLSDRDRDEVRRRFLRESRAAGRLIHPHIVTVLDVGEFHDGDLFIAMEYIDGPTLDKFARTSDLLEVERVLHFLCQACEALAFAHRHRIVHRDLKPANLMLADGDRLKVTDFGLAKDPGTELTHAGTLIGTPSYMSPEQIAGKPLDGRSDLFSLGVVLFELLTGQRPFPGDSISTVIYRVLHEEPPEPTTLNRRLPEALNPLLRKALHKDPAVRFQTGSEMARALRDFRSLPAIPTAVTTQVRTAAISPLAPARQRPRRVPSRDAEAPARRGGAVKGFVLGLVALILLGVTLTSLVPRLRRAVRRTLAPNLLAGTRFGETGDDWLRLTADRPGALFQLDGAPVSSDRLVRDASLSGRVLVASDGCLRGARVLPQKLPDGPVHVALSEPVVSGIPLVSVPDGAAVAVDGVPTETMTPTEVPLEACVSHEVTLSRPGHRTATLRFPAEGDWLAIAAEPVALEPLPDGRLRVESPYPLAILEDGVRIGTSEDELTLAAGRHTLVLNSRPHRVRLVEEVHIEPGVEQVLRPKLPPLGRLRINSLPGNATIVVDGVAAGPPPLELNLAVGSHDITCRWHVGRPRVARRQVTVSEGISNRPVNFRQGH